MGHDFSQHPIVLRVGSRHPLADHLPRADGMQAVYSGTGIYLHVLLGDCTETDVQVFHSGERKFGLLPLPGGYVWLMHDGIANWDAPYSPNIEPPHRRSLPWTEDDLVGTDCRAPIDLILVDGQRVVRAIKMVSLSPHFTRTLIALHEKAEWQPALASTWNAEVNRYFSRYPAPKHAFPHAAATCRAVDC